MQAILRFRFMGIRSITKIRDTILSRCNEGPWVSDLYVLTSGSNSELSTVLCPDRIIHWSKKVSSYINVFRLFASHIYLLIFFISFSILTLSSKCSSRSFLVVSIFFKANPTLLQTTKLTNATRSQQSSFNSLQFSCTHFLIIHDFYHMICEIEYASRSFSTLT